MLKKELIIFKNERPSRQEIYKSIRHFCSEHNKEFKFLNQKGPVTFFMDGELYQAELMEEHLDQPVYWTIRCRAQQLAAAQ